MEGLTLSALMISGGRSRSAGVRGSFQGLRSCRALISPGDAVAVPSFMIFRLLEGLRVLIFPKIPGHFQKLFLKILSGRS